MIKAKRRQVARDDWETIVLIPHKILEGDLPALLIEEHVHWLSLSTSVLEICSLDSIWGTSPKNWKVDCILGQYRMHRGHELLVNVRSPSWAMVSELLKPLETPSHLLVSASPIDSGRPSPSWQLSVLLPRYGLSFYVDKDGDLQSRDIRGMVYDENQCIGTLFGLVNRLVLRPKVKDANVVDLIPRCVLIPEGGVSFRKLDHHVRVEVSIPQSALDRVHYRTYRINTDLGFLETVGLTNRLYCAYLHALTSGCGTDPLIGRSGTEEALSLLRSASCWSTMKISPRDAKLLGLIASICPSHEGFRCVQPVKWLDLPVISQHPELYLVARTIKTHYEKLLSFHENQQNDIFQGFPFREGCLLERSARRASYLFPSDPARQQSVANCHDVCYRGRDLVKYGSGEHLAYTTATIVYRRTATTTMRKNILGMIESRTTLPGNVPPVSLQYDRSWLDPDLRSMWLMLYNTLRRSSERKWFQLFFTLPAMAYTSPKLSDLAPVLVAFASYPQFSFEDPPPYRSYTLSDGYSPSRDSLRQYITASAHCLDRSYESSMSTRYHVRLDPDINAMVNQLLRSWPCETSPPCPLNPELYDVGFLTSRVQSHFSSCYRNVKLKEHLTRVQKLLHNVQATPIPTVQYSFDPPESIPSYIPWTLAIKQLFSRPQPWLSEHNTLPHCAANVEMTSFSGAVAMRQLITIADANAINPFQRRYISALRASADSFESEMSIVSHGVTELPDSETLVAHYARCRATYAESIHRLQQHLGPSSLSERALQQSGQWPCTTPCVLLRFLASNSPVTLSDDWKGCLIRLALLVLHVQRARRLVRLHLENSHEELRKELQNGGCDGWKAEMHPDWLLIQVCCPSCRCVYLLTSRLTCYQLEGNFFVRRVQAEVAHQMISPHSGDNTAMQLNMGEGKSSVTVPIVVAVLANGDQLVRVIVPKALTAQMFHILVERLGGLTNRRVYFIPFSRSLQVDRRKAEVLLEVMLECMEERGVLVVQPEHVLSLKLVSVEKQFQNYPVGPALLTLQHWRHFLSRYKARDDQVGPALLELQRWLHSRSRDILDESDEILHVRYQLVYAVGNQQHMDGFPERWTTTQRILSLVSNHAASLQEAFPLEAEYKRDQSGSFPHLRILHEDAGQKLISCVLKDVIDGHLPNFSFVHLRQDLKDAIQSFISSEDVSDEKARLVKEYSQGTPLWGGLLLLRGLLATGILLFAFRQCRWRVDYGFAPERTMLAVPYRAKDIPAQRAEFGHPDVAIILTCLSYYYGGLEEKQLKQSFEILLKQDEPSVDYDHWVRECFSIPDSLRTLSGINMKSSEQWCNHLVPLFSRNKAMIDFYLSRVVFPKEAKEFPKKLACSGWDLVEKQARLVTGE